MAELSFLDLVPILDGGTVADALRRAADMAKACEAAGYKRYWVAEHHGMAGVGAAATAVVIGHIGAATATIRVGAGGIMLPNHSPLQVAEQFGTLDALFPGRVDLGLGRAPGSDQRVMRAMRRGLNSSPDDFPRDVVELQALFAGSDEVGITATPGAGANPELWILGSSTFGAQLAAYLGLPYGFASHFAPGMIDEALRVYRANFRPSAVLNKPHVMAGYNVIGADSDDEAALLATSMQQGLVALWSGETRGGLRPPVAGFFETLSAQQKAGLAQFHAFTSVGTRATLRDGFAAFLERTGADEVIVTSQVWDHAARMNSIAIAAEAFADVTQA
ncbi:MAG: LLM class flavin-dependent oxidoreductase [Sphingomonadales bacterium]|nr:LLM class flavin-dependent oxidoreductase [Sphingomonadales bacterium]